MNNEPVAWMFQGAFDISTYVSFEKPNPDIYPNPTPLYTHPAKTLTDEEIEEMNANELADQLERDVKDFFPIPDEICLTAATMLRQQQAEIEALKTELKLIDELVTGKAQEK